MKASLVLVSLIGVGCATVTPPAGCAYDKCFWKDQVPQEWKPAITKFCKALVGKEKCSTTSSAGFSTVIRTNTPTTLLSTPPPTTIVQTVQYTSTVIDSVDVTNVQTVGTDCAVTVPGTYTTDITYPRFTPVAAGQPRSLDELAAQDDPKYRRRMKRDTLPDFATAGCNKSPPLQKLKDACKCFLAGSQPQPSPSARGEQNAQHP